MNCLVLFVSIGARTHVGDGRAFFLAPAVERINPRIGRVERKTKARFGDIYTHGREGLSTNTKDSKETMAQRVRTRVK